MSNSSRGPQRRPERPDDGLGLVEVIVAMGTLLAAALVMLSTTLGVEATSAANGERAAALQQTQAFLEQMHATPLADLDDVFPHDAEVVGFNDRGVRGLRIRVLYDDGDTTARPLRYTVVTTWLGATGRTWRTDIKGVRSR